MSDKDCKCTPMPGMASGVYGLARSDKAKRERESRCAKGSAERSEATETERTAKEIPYFVPNLTELRILLAVTLVLGGVIVYILVSEWLHYAVGP